MVGGLGPKALLSSPESGWSWAGFSHPSFSPGQVGGKGEGERDREIAWWRPSEVWSLLAMQ